MLYRFSIENCLFFLWLYQNFHSSFRYRLVAVSVTFFAVRNVINHAPTTKITPLRQKPRPLHKKIMPSTWIWWTAILPFCYFFAIIRKFNYKKFAIEHILHI